LLHPRTILLTSYGMPASEILFHEAASNAPVLLADTSSVVSSSAGSGWSGLAVERQHLPATETPEGYMPWHLLSVQLSPPPLFEDRRDGRIRLAPGDVIFRPAGVVDRASWTGPSEVINVAVDPAVVAAAPERSAFGPDPVVRHLAMALATEAANGSPGGPLLADGVREALAAHLAARYADARLPAGPRRLTHAELSRVLDLIDVGLSDELRLADLAAAVPLSPYHFSRAFKATTGLTPHRFVVRRRVEAARGLLRRGDLGVEQVAQRTGFADGAHLARQFRRRFGMTPSAFRARV
jgi:AraC family transcriptional regulator